MPDLSNRELDDLFREGAEMQEFGYNEAAWNDVAGRLDTQDRRRKGLIIFFSSVLALAIAVGVWMSYSYNDVDKIESKVSIDSESIDNSAISTLIVESSERKDAPTVSEQLSSAETVNNTIDMTKNATLVYPTKEVFIDKINAKKSANELAKQGTSLSIGDIEKIAKQTTVKQENTLNNAHPTPVAEKSRL